MFVVDKKGSQWAIDEVLRDKAISLIHKYDHLVGHVDPAQVIFLRFTGSRQANWLGKTYFIDKTPLNIVGKYVVSKLAGYGLLDLNQITGIEDDLFDLRYIIAINDYAISESPAFPDKVEEITLLHELMHISPCLEKIVKHNVEDFKEILDEFGTHWDEGIITEPVNEEIIQNPMIPVPQLLPVAPTRKAPAKVPNFNFAKPEGSISLEESN